MQLVRFTPNALSNSRQKSTTSFFDELFDDFFGTPFHAGVPGRVSGRHHLQVDIYEKENTIVIEAEMPGVAKEDVKLDVKGKHLTLGYERKQDKEIKDEQSFRRERSFGSFQRAFTLPFEIDTDKVEASLTDGVLRVTVNKPEEQKARQITIN